MAVALFVMANHVEARNPFAPQDAFRQAAVQAVRIGTYDEFTRVLLRLNVPVTPKLFTLSNPDRLIIDMPRIGWAIPSPSGAVRSRLVKGFRFGLLTPSISRLVFTLSGPAEIVDFKVVPTLGQGGYELDIQLSEGGPTRYRAESSTRIDRPIVAFADRTRAASLPAAPKVDQQTRQAFQARQFDPQSAEYDALGDLLAGLDKGIVPPPTVPEPEKAPPAEPVVVETPAPAPVEVAKAEPKPKKPAAPKSEAQVKVTSMTAALGPRIKPLAEPRKSPRRRPLRIVIDPGHGGRDPGAGEAVGLREASTVLSFSRELLALLNADPNYKAFTTRDSDTFISLPDRVAFAREKNANLFISIHADWFHDPSVGGAGAYMLSEEDSIRSTEEFAFEHEDAGKIAGIDISEEREDVVRVLLDLSRRETQIGSRRFAEMVRDELSAVTPVKRNFVGHNNFHVLKAPDMPSVLLELGFMSNPDDLKRLTSSEWRSSAARALKKAIDAWRLERGTRELALR